MPNRFRLFVGGYRSGKTRAGEMEMCKHYWEHPGVNQGYFAPTYSMIRDAFFQTIEEVAMGFGLNVKIREQAKEVHFYSGRQYRGTTLCRSMDNPGSIVGFEIGHAVIDELDVLPINKAEEAWRKIIARMSYKGDGVRNGVDVCTTPEGFRFCHKQFVRLPQERPDMATNYGRVHASTRENAHNLPEGYIDSLIEAYPPELIEAYLNGQFVNLTSGTVYRNYNRERCNSTETIREKEPLFIGCDFNVQHTAACIHVQRPDGWHQVAELKEVYDTPDLIKIIDERWKSKGHSIIVYPDATGGSRKSVDASKSDIALLQQAGYAIRAKSTNPPVKDRVIAVNKAFENGKYKINAATCPWSVQCREQQAYDANGEPDKASGFDHQNDAGDYFVFYEMPVIKPMTRMQVVGI